MNKIVVANDEIIEVQTDNKVKVYSDKKCEFLNVKLIKVDVLEDTSLTLNFSNTKEAKFEVCINVKANINFNLYERKDKGLYKIYYNYILEENSNANILKIHDTDRIKEQTIIKLNGKNAHINHTLKTISKDEEKYDFLIYHEALETCSNIINNGVNIRKGELTFTVSSFVPKGIINCNVSQNNRIINLTDNKCKIKPNLFIDENDVNASHSALIGTFSEDRLFYLMSRGISKIKAENLLIKGFLLNNALIYEKEVAQIINKYWR